MLPSRSVPIHPHQHPAGHRAWPPSAPSVGARNSSRDTLRGVEHVHGSQPQQAARSKASSQHPTVDALSSDNSEQSSSHTTLAPRSDSHQSANSFVTTMPSHHALWSPTNGHHGNHRRPGSLAMSQPTPPWSASSSGLRPTAPASVPSRQMVSYNGSSSTGGGNRDPKEPIATGPNGQRRLTAANISSERRREALAQVPCKFFRNGGCSAGASCAFSHTLPDDPNAPDADGVGSGTNVICQWFLRGNCRFGAKCALAHIYPGQSVSVRIL